MNIESNLFPFLLLVDRDIDVVLVAYSVLVNVKHDTVDVFSFAPFGLLGFDVDVIDIFRTVALAIYGVLVNADLDCVSVFSV